MQTSLFEKYGGFDTVSEIVQDFYHDVLDSENLRDYFLKMDLETLMDHQIRFLCYLLGGPANNESQELQIIHKTLKISNEEFIEVVSILEENLRDAGINNSDLSGIMDLVSGTQRDRQIIH